MKVFCPLCQEIFRPSVAAATNIQTNLTLALRCNPVPTRPAPLLFVSLGSELAFVFHTHTPILPPCSAAPPPLLFGHTTPSFLTNGTHYRLCLQYPARQPLTTIYPSSSLLCVPAHVDGAYFGTTFPHLFFLSKPHLVPREPLVRYVPRVFGFKLFHPSHLRVGDREGLEPVPTAAHPRPEDGLASGIPPSAGAGGVSAAVSAGPGGVGECAHGMHANLCCICDSCLVLIPISSHPLAPMPSC
jgi:hypothetical protein